MGEAVEDGGKGIYNPAGHYLRAHEFISLQLPRFGAVSGTKLPAGEGALNGSKRTLGTAVGRRLGRVSVRYAGASVEQDPVGCAVDSYEDQGE